MCKPFFFCIHHHDPTDDPFAHKILAAAQVREEAQFESAGGLGDFWVQDGCLDDSSFAGRLGVLLG